MRKLVISILLVASSVAAADVLAQLSLERDVACRAFFNYVAYGWVVPPGGIASAKLIAAGRRPAAVAALGAVARSCFASPEFATKYADYRATKVPREPRRPMPRPDPEVPVRLEQGLKIIESDLQNLPAPEREAVRAAISALTANATDYVARAGATGDEERYERALREYELALSKAPPEKPEVRLRERLNAFLELTADMPWDAKLVPRYGRTIFEDPKLQEKPPEWKMAFRAGREATEAARAFAKKWVAELGR